MHSCAAAAGDFLKTESDTEDNRRRTSGRYTRVSARVTPLHLGRKNEKVTGKINGKIGFVDVGLVTL